MSAIEQRARELLAAEFNATMKRASPKMLALHDAAVQAIIAALTPPEGYVLVPQVLPEPMLDALYRAEGDMSDADMQSLWADILAARPENSNVH